MIKVKSFSTMNKIKVHRKGFTFLETLYTYKYSLYSVMKKIVVVLSLAVLTFLVGWLIATSFTSAEIVTCKTLQAQSKEYRNFFITQSDKEMCDYHKIWIDAPVLKYDNNN